MSLRFDGLHETVIKDVVDVIKDGIDQAEGIGFNIRGTNRLSTSSSLSKATEGLILVFPHLCSMGVSSETASMLTKAIETKAVSILQIAFSAFNITNSTDAVDFVKQFHTNIGGKMTIDKFIDTMDAATNESTNSLNGIDRRLVKAVLEEFKQMECYFEEDLYEGSINDFKVVNRFGKYVVTEARKDVDDDTRDYSASSRYRKDGIAADMYNDRMFYGQDAERTRTEYNRKVERDEDRQNKLDDDETNRQFKIDQDQKNRDFQDSQAEKKRQWQKDDREEDDKYRKERDKIKDKYDKDTLSQRKAADDNKAFKDDFDMLRQQLLPSDIKKANEMVPSMMIINFNTRDEKLQTVIRSQAVIGVKAKLYPASSDDIINKIIVKNADNNVLLKLLRVSTRELNFVKDFLLAIDDAKLTAVSCSTRGSDTNKFLKLLERRALRGKIRKKLNMNNAYKAITTITITREEADFIKRYNNIDVFNVNTIRKIMESLNIMQFIIADDTEECAYIIMDSGDDMYEKISYTHLERESTDGSYKKAINLMTKVVR